MNNPDYIPRWAPMLTAIIIGLLLLYVLVSFIVELIIDIYFWFKNKNKKSKHMNLPDEDYGYQEDHDYHQPELTGKPDNPFGCLLAVLIVLGTLAFVTWRLLWY
jgi:hypothetical protein